MIFLHVTIYRFEPLWDTPVSEIVVDLAVAPRSALRYRQSLVLTSHLADQICPRVCWRNVSFKSREEGILSRRVVEQCIGNWVQDNLNMYSGNPVDDHLSYATTPPRRPNFPIPDGFQFPLTAALTYATTGLDGPVQAANYISSAVYMYTWRVWFQNAITAKSNISELTTPCCCTNEVV
jgi:hypothetical protein